MQTTCELVLSLVQEAFKRAWENRENIPENNKRSSFFVSQLAEIFADKFGGRPLVQKTDKNGNKIPGEWLLDIAIVSEKKISTSYKNRSATIVEKIIWAIESEFSTNLREFCKDFSKLVHIKAERYLYVAGLNQSGKEPRDAYINGHIELARSLVSDHSIVEPFYLVFIPTPRRTAIRGSIWDRHTFDKLRSWFIVEGLSSRSL